MTQTRAHIKDSMESIAFSLTDTKLDARVFDTEL